LGQRFGVEHDRRVEMFELRRPCLIEKYDDDDERCNYYFVTIISN
jgi:hypothetical protein